MYCVRKVHLLFPVSDLIFLGKFLFCDFSFVLPLNFGWADLAVMCFPSLRRGETGVLGGLSQWCGSQPYDWESSW